MPCALYSSLLEPNPAAALGLFIVAPIKGNAVFFSYPRPDAATHTLHGGAPVQAGEKWVATKWLRQREFR